MYILSLQARKIHWEGASKSETCLRAISDSTFDLVKSQVAFWKPNKSDACKSSIVSLADSTCFPGNFDLGKPFSDQDLPYESI